MRTARQTPVRRIQTRTCVRPPRRRVVGRLGLPWVPRLGVALTLGLSDESLVVFRGIGGNGLQGRRLRADVELGADPVTGH